ncbi:MAG: ABC transporter substrate-binding protein [Rhodospirillales bacterium]|nr:ABC transporter substrate-binding protein [Rhodospirillales bacterium]
MFKGVNTFLSLFFFLCYISTASSFELIETPMLIDEVSNGRLPSIGDRVPSKPSIVDTSGKSGGIINILMGRKKDTRQLVVYGYARLVGYDKKFNIRPDILSKIDVKDGRIFTLYLRKGHKWSDGHPFTAEDFRYYWEDVANNNEVANENVPSSMIIEGQKPEFKILNNFTIRYIWKKPNPFFLPRLAGARPLYIYRPAHYLKKFHIKYVDKSVLEAKAKYANKRNWLALHYSVSEQYKNSNPDLPSLQPWTLSTRPPSKRLKFKRNKYYHRIDRAGRQLPYLDEIRMNVTSGKLIPIKTGGGESDLQGRGLSFSNVTALKQSEESSGFKTLLWKTAKGSRWALFPNLNTNDVQWKKILRDVRFRRALSMAINRHEINQVIYYGLARPGNNTVLPESPLYRSSYQKRWANFNIDESNRLLDEMGLTKRTDAGIRLLPNGKKLEFTVAFSTEETESSDVLELISDTWRKIGVKIFLKPMQREVLRNRIFSGAIKMSMWSGLENGIPNAQSSPHELSPTSQQQLQWPKWGQYAETNGDSGRPVDMEQALRLSLLNKKWTASTGNDQRREIWGKMLDVYTDQVFSIGIIASVPKVIVANKNIKNIPKTAIYNWDPGAHFGVHRPDQFWLDDPALRRYK